MKKHLLPYLLLLILTACSTTAHLPEGEVLYTGQKSTKINNFKSTPTGELALEEINAAIDKAPNNSLMGLPTVRLPLPFGLWIYNSTVNCEKGLGRWIFNHFAANPVLLSAVNPGIRTKAAGNILKEYGYFQGSAGYETFINPKNERKAKVQYTIHFGEPYTIDTVFYKGFKPQTMRLMERGRRRTLLPANTQFNVVDLDAERTRISTMLRNIGYYYFRPDYMVYQADTTLAAGPHVSLRLQPVQGMPDEAERIYYEGNRSFYLYDSKSTNTELTDSVRYKDLTIYYNNKLRVRPKMLYRWVNYKGFRGKIQMDSVGQQRMRDFQHRYSLQRQNRIQERLYNVGIFRSLEIQNIQRGDSTHMTDTLDVHIIAGLDKAYNAELDFNVKTKSNNQTGPGAAFTLTKKNVFGGGESWDIAVDGSYEFQTGKGSSSAMNSYELNLSSSLTFPRIVLPKIRHREYDYPASTTFKLYANQVNRAKYYKLLAFGGNVTYDFQPTATGKHSITPFKLTYNVLRNPTAEFDELRENNPALYVSLRNQFIPAIEYTYTYDNSSVKSVKNPIWWQTTVSSAGNILSCFYALAGKGFAEKEKDLFGVPFAQYLKLNSEFRYRHRLTKSTLLATRIALGAIWSYGNTSSAPYTEQFYIGGANSVRSFTTRYAGPGSYAPADDTYSFINHVGDLRFEANAEYRFNIFSDIYGAVFLDAGNVWLLRKDEARPGATFNFRDCWKQIALGTGVGLRYDMDFLVFRLDLGIGIHNPWDTGKSGYYNITRFKDSLALHFAIGYPF